MNFGSESTQENFGEQAGDPAVIWGRRLSRIYGRREAKPRRRGQPDPQPRPVASHTMARTHSGQKRIRERAAANFVVLLKDWTLFEQQFLQRPLPRTFFAGFATFLIDFG
jgi:hypothetical protein